MATFYAVHNGPQGDESGDSVANGMSLAGAIAAITAAGDEVRVCATGAYTTTADLDQTVAGTLAAPISILGANASGTVDGTRPSIDRGGNRGIVAVVSYQVVRHLDWTGSAAVIREAVRVGNYSVISDCSEDSQGTSGGGFRCAGGVVRRCEYTGTGAIGFQIDSGIAEDCVSRGGSSGFAGTTAQRNSTAFVNCIAYDCTTGFRLQATTQAGSAVIGCLAYECGEGLFFNNSAGANVSSMTVVRNCVFADCDDGINTNETEFRAMVIENCIFANNDYGINNATAFSPSVADFLTRCAFYSSTSGHLAIGSVPADCETGTDPLFVDDTNATLALRNYQLSASSTFINKQFTGIGPNFVSYPDWGYAQSEPAAGGGGGGFYVSQSARMLR